MRPSILATVTVTMFLLLTAAAGFTHGKEKHKGKVTKATPMKMMQTMTDSTAGDHDEMAESMMSGHEQQSEAAIQKDIEQIIADTKSSATATVVKVSSLTLVLLGLVIAYYPKSKSIASGGNGNKKGQAHGK